jgi:2-keto-3-deoxy-L-fuconate dehydrogenase
MRLHGKTALVTAAGQGIGRASALAMAAEGAEVWATDVDAALLERYAGVANVRVARLDVLDRAAIGALFATLPRVDVLFNCAGIVHNGSALDASDADLELAFALNVRAQLWTIQAALPGMRPRRRQHHQHGEHRLEHQGPAEPLRLRPHQGGGDRPDQERRRRLRPRGIRCNALCPGTVDTPSLAGRINAYADPVAARQAFVDRQPMGRLAQAEEIAPMVVYLASDESRFATGQAFCVDGGMTI